MSVVSRSRTWHRVVAWVVASTFGLVTGPNPARECRGPRCDRRGPQRAFLEACRGRRGGDPSVPHQRSGKEPRRPAQAGGGDTVARQGDGHGSIPGCAAGEAPGARPLLGNRLRLAKGRSEAQCLAAVRHDHRRPRHPVRACPLASAERVAADHDARLARLGPRTGEGDRSADRSIAYGGRAEDAFDLVLPSYPARLLRQAARHGLGSAPHRARMGRTDAATGIHALRVSRR